MISVIRCDEATIWHPVGDLDMSTIVHVRRTLEAIASEPRVVIDLCNVGFIDSAGLGALIGAIHRADGSGQQIAMCCRQPPLLRLFDTVGLVETVAIEADRECALAALLNDGSASHENRDEPVAVRDSGEHESIYEP